MRRQASRERTSRAGQDRGGSRLRPSGASDLSGRYAVTTYIGQIADDALDRAADLVRSDRAVVVDRGPQRAGDCAFETAR
jgi:hypothetical protein